MIYFSIALVIIAVLMFSLANKWMDLRVIEKNTLNKEASSDALNAAVDELSKKLDTRINKCFENHQIIKTEMDSMKLQYGLKGR